MRDIAERRLLSVMRPGRVVILLAALFLVILGWQLSTSLYLIVLVLVLAALMTAVLLPAIREAEFGFPRGVKDSAVLRKRREELEFAFESQHEELELCAQLICDDPDEAAELLEAAWARTAAAWRGPVNPGIRNVVLHELVHLGRAARRKAGPPGDSRQGNRAGGRTHSLLGLLTFDDRAAVVLHDFADLSTAEIARIAGIPEQQIMAAVNRFPYIAEGARDDPGTL